MPSSPRVAILIESSRAYGRGLLSGAAAYVRCHAPWAIYQHERGLADAVPAWFENWAGDGIIARIESKNLADKIEELALPTVDLRGVFEIPNVPLIETNDLAVARMACSHLLELGFRRIAYCGFANANFSERRKQFVINHLAEFGIFPEVLDTPKIQAKDTATIEVEGLLHEEELGEWLSSLEKPIGLIACNDNRARQVLIACREFEISVPDDVAIVGVDNDLLICELTDPPLSSVENDTFQIGYRAAEQLDCMMQGNMPSQQRTLVNPIGVVPRRSTEVLAVDDKDVATAMRMIRDHARSGISVNDIANQLHMSRSTLDRRFAKAIGRSPKSEINRVLIESVKQLLTDTDYKLTQVAKLAGFEYAEYMCTLFKEKTGVTPGEFRKMHQIRRNNQTG